MIEIVRCPGCGAVINASGADKCDYCQMPFTKKEVKPTVNDYLKDARDRFDDFSDKVYHPRKKINVAVVILLSIFFWPAAIIYIATRYHKD